jgi:transcription-repair coupling factor (superfamily II helicase)
MRDLEIRGVGNLLGREQHGHIAAVGYDLYLKMLDKEAKKQRKEAVEEPLETGVDIGVDAHIPSTYIADLRSRVEAYRSVVGTEDPEAARAGLEDRYGPPPPEVDNFLKVVKVKQLASAWRLSSVALGRGYVVATYQDRRRAKKLEATNPKEIRVVDDKAIHIYAEGNPSGTKLWRRRWIRLLTVDR